MAALPSHRVLQSAVGAQCFWCRVAIRLTYDVRELIVAGVCSRA